MNPKYVTSLELSKKLKELGIKQESEFYWIKKKNKWKLVYIGEKRKGLAFALIKIAGISAFLSGELGEIIKDVDWALPHYANGSWWAYGRSTNNPDIEAETLAEAMGKVFVYLKENKLI